jgi:Holliday junction DNA helicase RuvA
MIAFIEGRIAAYGADWVVLNNQGVGWKIAYPHTDEISLNQEVRIYTYMHITENDIALYGFRSQEEQDLFIRLIGVKGLGPKTALNMLTRSSMDNIIAAVEQGNVAALKALPGVGAKTASQIVLDLKGKLVQVPVKQGAAAQPVYSSEIMDAVEALKSLGWKPAEANNAAKVMNEHPGLSVNEYLRIGMQYLSKQ